MDLIGSLHVAAGEVSHDGGPVPTELFGEAARVEFGPDEGDESDSARIANVIEMAADQGINWLDTSENYYDTRNEVAIGAVLAEVKADVMVATKVSPGSAGSGGGSGFRPEQVRTACHASLRRPRRAHIDISFLHWPDATAVPLEDTWGAMVELVDAGLVRAIGMSNYNIADIERCHAARRVDVVQDGLSLIDHLDNRCLVRRCGELGVGVTIYEPLASGVLGGKSVEQVRAVWAAWADMPFINSCSCRDGRSGAGLSSTGFARLVRRSARRSRRSPSRGCSTRWESTPPSREAAVGSTCKRTHAPPHLTSPRCLTRSSS